MNALYIAASIPIFFLLIGIEFWVNHKRGANPAVERYPHQLKLWDGFLDQRCYFPKVLFWHSIPGFHPGHGT